MTWVTTAFVGEGHRYAPETQIRTVWFESKPCPRNNAHTNGKSLCCCTHTKKETKIAHVNRWLSAVCKNQWRSNHRFYTHTYSGGWYGPRKRFFTVDICTPPSVFFLDQHLLFKVKNKQNKKPTINFRSTTISLKWCHKTGHTVLRLKCWGTLTWVGC